MGTKNNTRPFDCYANAEPDEPLFVLLGRDKHAPTLVWLWATLRELDGEDPTKVKEARETVAQMLDWALKHNRTVVGIGQAGLAAMMELIRSMNEAARAMNVEARNSATDVQTMRLFLAKTAFEPGTKAS